MDYILNILMPVFGMSALGFAAGRSRLLGPNATNGLTEFVFKIAIPIMLFRALARLTLPTIEWQGMGAYYVSAITMYLLGSQFSRRVLGISRDDSAGIGMGAAFSNTLLMGLPIVMKIYGESGTLLLLLIISCHTTVLFGVGTVLVELGRAANGPRNLRAAVSKVAWGLASNPIILGLVSGVLFHFSGLQLPAWLDEIAKMFAEAAVPCALFTVGLSLTTFQLAGNLPQAIIITVSKLVIHPLLMWILARYIFDLTPLWTSVTVLAAAMPVGINAYLFAESIKAKSDTVAAAMLMSTCAGMITLTILVYLEI